MKKFCTGCEQELDVSKFNPNKTKQDSLQTQCKVCRALYNKEHYKNNKETYKLRVKNRRFEISNLIKEHKKDKSCSCGESRSPCLDFHHRDPKEKLVSIGEILMTGWSNEKVLSELDKCDIMCSNCHRFLHWKEKNIWE